MPLVRLRLAMSCPQSGGLCAPLALAFSYCPRRRAVSAPSPLQFAPYDVVRRAGSDRRPRIRGRFATKDEWEVMLSAHASADRAIPAMCKA